MTVSMQRAWVMVALAAGLELAGCGGDDAGAADEGGTTGDATGSPSTSTSGSSMTDGGSDTGGCIAGQVDCHCLNDMCVGSLQCIEGTCQPGPEFDVPDDESVLAGMRVPLEVEVMADEFSWEQVGGPMAELQGTDTTLLLVDTPADAQPGDVLTFRLDAVRNTIEDHVDIDIEIHDAVFENVVPDATAEELGTTEGLDFTNNDMWVVSTEGFVSRFQSVDGLGVFQNRFDIAGGPVGARIGRVEISQDNQIDVLFLAEATAQRVEYMMLDDGSTTLVTDQLEDGSPLGAVNFVLPSQNGDVFFSNRLDQKVLMYDAGDGVTRVLVENLGMNPNALAFGPDAGFLYIGTAGRVYRVPVLGEGMAGEPEVYLDLGPEDVTDQEVDGLEFDAGGNLWVGSPNDSTLYMARYVAEGPSEVANAWSDVAGGVSRFVNVRLGGGGFDRDVLHYTNLGDATVGRIWTGLERL